MNILKNASVRQGCLAKNEHRHLLQQMLLSLCSVCSLGGDIRHMVFAKDVYYFNKILPTLSYTLLRVTVNSHNCKWLFGADSS